MLGWRSCWGVPWDSQQPWLSQADASQEGSHNLRGAADTLHCPGPPKGPVTLYHLCGTRGPPLATTLAISDSKALQGPLLHLSQSLWVAHGCCTTSCWVNKQPGAPKPALQHPGQCLAGHRSWAAGLWGLESQCPAGPGQTRVLLLRAVLTISSPGLPVQEKDSSAPSTSPQFTGPRAPCHRQPQLPQSNCGVGTETAFLK